MLEIKKNGVSGEYELVIDGVVSSKRKVEVQNHDLVPERPLFSADIYDSLQIQKISAHRFSDLPKYLLVLILNIDGNFSSSNVRKTIRVRANDVQRAVQIGAVDTGYTVSFDFDFDLENWKHPWSVTEYIEECERIFNQKSPADLRWGRRGFTSASGGFSFYTDNPDNRNTIESEISKHSEAIRELLELTEASLTEKLRSDSVVMHFDFPEEVKVPCEQYLLYFAQFLRDLGVKADTALTHEAGQVLFTVTPQDKDQALDKIRAALDAYLHLPSNPVSDTTNESIAVQRLEANVLRLRSDLKLAAAELQAKDTTIEAQRLMLDVQKGLLSGEIVFNAVKNVTPAPKDKDKEEFLGGTVSLIPIKGKGVEINLPELFRRLKRLLTEE